MINSVNIGEYTEKMTLHYLQCQGLTLIDKNWRCPLGEIDIIMQQTNTLVFIEVRYRKTQTCGAATESVTLKKQAKIIHTANAFLQKNLKLAKMSCRFDVIALSGNIHSPHIQWIKSAFSLSV